MKLKLEMLFVLDEIKYQMKLDEIEINKRILSMLLLNYTPKDS